jgi:hypothetical protein
MVRITVHGNEKFCIFSSMLKYMAQTHISRFFKLYEYLCSSVSIFKRKIADVNILNCLGLFVLQQNYVHIIFNVYLL